MRDGILYPQQRRERHIDGSGCGYWPTPDSNCGKRFGQHPQRINPRRTFTINDAVRMWPMPRANKVGGYSSPGYSPTLETAIGGQLNPTWVEWLIGWPLEWTALQPLGTAKFQQWSSKHGIY